MSSPDDSAVSSSTENAKPEEVDLKPDEEEVALDGIDLADTPPPPKPTKEANTTTEASSPPLTTDEPWRAFQIQEFTRLKKSDSEMDKLGSSGKDSMHKFYNKQNSIIDLFEEAEKHKSNSSSNLGQHLEDDDDRTDVKIAIRGSFAVNIFLVVMKIVLSARSRSLSVIASALDSILDIVSGSIIFVISYLSKKQDRYKYPVGKNRLEPLGIVIFSTLMFTTALQLIIEASKRLITQNKDFIIDRYTLGGLILTVVLKGILYLYCRKVDGSASAEALAQDHRNDVLSNSVSIASVLIGFYTPYWWADGTGGIIIGLYIMFIWLRTGFETVRMLTGYTAPVEMLQKWTYVALHHHESIQKIDTVRAYHLSEGFILEVDIVLPEDMALREAHDIGESLQHKLEEDEQVERCFVHLDFECEHKPEH